MKKYRERVVDSFLKRKLEAKGAVVVEGAKWCGKTTTAEQVAGSILYMDEPRNRQQNIQMAVLNPSLLLEGKTPRLLDEWQIAPILWDAVRFEVDHRDEMGQFILTGSSVPPFNEPQIFHSGTGRFTRLKMRTMTLYESEESNGNVSLSNLFAHPEQDITGKNELNFSRLAFLVCRGGWPSSLNLHDDIALEQAYDYYDAVVSNDISRADNVQRNSDYVRKLMRSYARNQGTQVTLENIRKDVSADSASLSADTVSSYINALKRIFVIEDVSAWNPDLRSKTAIRTTDTRYFTDPSIAVAALGISPDDLMQANNLPLFGLLFETMCIRDLRVFAEAMGGEVRHYRDKTGLECDAVVRLRNGKYGLIEIKLGGDFAIDEAASNLIKLKNKIDTDKMNSPAFMMVLTGTSTYAYKRNDGVLVVPVGCLGK